MKRITLLLMVMAAALLAVSGVAWAVTTTCPPEPEICWGTSGDDVLKSTSQDNLMFGRTGNDTYTNFVRGNSGHDGIVDPGGKDELLLTNYSKSEVEEIPEDSDNNGKVESVVLVLGPGEQNTVGILGYYDDTTSTCPCKPGPGNIETIIYK